MTDLELTKKCAEAMGYKITLRNTRDDKPYWQHDVNAQAYEPLVDGAEAMALVKKLALDIYAPRKDFHWIVGTASITRVENTDLNRAIVECVAKLQGAQ